MSKISFAIQNFDSVKTQSPNLVKRDSFGKLSLDFNGTDFKSTLLNNNNFSQEKSLLSPASPSERTNYSLTKSLHLKAHPISGPNESLEPKEISKSSKKSQQLKTNTLMSSPIGLGRKQVSSSNEKLVPAKIKEYQMKGVFAGYENGVIKNSIQNKDKIKGALALNLKDTKLKIMEEPKKKASMPSTLALSLNNLYTNPGSKSHRANAGPPILDEQKQSGGALLAGSLTHKGYKKVAFEQESPRTQLITNRHALNSLQDLAPSVLSDSRKAGLTANASRIHTEASGSKIRDTNDWAAQYNKLLQMVNEKNKEIQKLSQDKNELKLTLDSLNTEIQGMKQMKNVLREKEAIIRDLKNAISEAVKESGTLKKELQLENQIGQKSANISSHRRGNSSSGGDMESVKALFHQLETIATHQDDISSQKLPQQKDSLLAIISRKQKQSSPQKIKHPTLPNSESRGAKLLNSRNTPQEILRRSVSNNTLEDISLSKNEYSYYSTHRNTPKKDIRMASASKKNNSSIPKKSSPEPQSNKSKTSNKKTSSKNRESSLETTSHQIHSKSEKREKQNNNQPSPNGPVGEDLAMFKRTFSHEPMKMGAFNLELLAKKGSMIELEGSMISEKAKKIPEESIDIGKALREIKEKVGIVLGKHREEYKKLKRAQDVYLQKLEKLSGY